MADISIVIQGQATAAASAVDTLIGKLNQLSSSLDNIASKASTAFSGFRNVDGGGLGEFEQRIASIEQRLGSLQGSSSGASASMKETTTTIEKSGQTASKASGFFSKLGSSFARIAFYRFLRTVLKEITQGFKEGMENAYQYSKAVGGPLAAAFDKVKSAGSQMKNQLGAALGTLVQQLAPVVNAAISLLTRLAQILTQIFSLFGGSGTYLQATAQDVTDVGNAAGGAGGKIKGMLAAWDELNVIGQDKSGGGGGGGSAQDYESMFTEAPIESWLQQAFDASGISESIDRIKESWNLLVDAIKNGDFEFGINTFMLDPLRTVIDTLDGVIILLRGIMSGDLWAVGAGLGKLIFDSIINTVVIPFTRTIDAIFGTNLTEKVLKFKDDVDNGLAGIADPSVTNPIRERISKPFKEAWAKIKEVFEPVVEWFSGVFESVSQIIRGIFSYLWNEILREPVLKFLLWAIDVFEPFVVAVAEGIDLIYAVVATVIEAIRVVIVKIFNFIIEHILNPIIKLINKIGEAAAEYLGETYNGIAEIKPIANDSFNAIEKDALGAADAVKNAFAGTREYLQNELSADPVVTYHYNNAPQPMQTNSANTNIVMPFAEGGFVTTGQLFVAREAGPELVGSIGSHTAVANNDQIVAGIASGVREAEAEQNGLLRQQNAILAQLLAKELTISPSAALGQVVARSNALYARS